ncbi:T9SS type A sorting domain-containing protein [Hymenobacter sp. ASUV-10]|uniref:T9SS type A sorting domain-containing protein n=1 Tax=Hymenobacter aranciens TaxID=3063996 RepID=A0ABT9BBH2_9BACT|nr:T9SS type A sorting domain-containing protein [Hymenobacter sp. ASUV-10]MDO7875598.1 T9SS type A sorting domain-containing protein [Hymenobacter sp. ASUV-10]
MTPVYSFFWRRVLGALLLSGLLGLVAHAQPAALQPVLLARAAGTGSADIAALAATSGGDYYVAGNFTGSITVGTVPLSSTGGTDAFVARCQAGTGAVQWVLPLTGPVEEQITCLSWHNNALYVGGRFRSARLTLDGQTIANADPANIGSRDGFVAKITDQGTRGRVVWAYDLGGATEDYVTALAGNGDRVYVGGTFDSPSISLAGTPLDNSQPRPATLATTDGFVAALLDLGATAAVSWVLPAAGVGREEVTALAVSGPTVYVGGTHTSVGGSLSQLGSISLAPAGRPAAFVGRVQDGLQTANPVWVEELRGSGPVFLSALALLPGSVYVSGTFEGVTDTLPIGPDILTNAGNTDGYLARLDDAGATASWAWGRHASGWGYEGLQALATDGKSIYAAGRFNSPTLTLGSTVLPNPLPAPGVGLDAFVTRLTTSGTFVETQAIAGDGNALAHAVLAIGSQLYLGGSFGGNATFGSQLLTSASNAGYVASVAFRPLGGRAGAALPGLALAPNPASGRAELRLPAGSGAAPFSISMLDALGRVVRRREVAATAGGQTIMLELAGLAPGVYAVRVQQGAAQAVQKLVVE